MTLDKDMFNTCENKSKQTDQLINVDLKRSDSLECLNIWVQSDGWDTSLPFVATFVLSLVFLVSFGGSRYQENHVFLLQIIAKYSIPVPYFLVVF